MREIKFRVWDSISNQYRLLSWNTNKQNLGLWFEVSGGIGSNVTTMYHSVGDVVEQYTGLKDKNGVDIYVGDIIEATIQGCIQDDKYLVKNVWDPHVWIEESDSYYVVSEMGVKGNIHDNPELLEVDK